MTGTHPTRALRLEGRKGEDVMTRVTDAVRRVPARGWRRWRGLARSLDAENVTWGPADGQHHTAGSFPQHFKGLLEQEVTSN